MPETRQRHDREFRAGAVSIVTETANPVTQVAAPRAAVEDLSRRRLVGFTHSHTTPTAFSPPTPSTSRRRPRRRRRRVDPSHRPPAGNTPQV